MDTDGRRYAPETAGFTAESRRTQRNGDEVPPLRAAAPPPDGRRASPIGGLSRPGRAACGGCESGAEAPQSTEVGAKNGDEVPPLRAVAPHSGRDDGWGRKGGTAGSVRESQHREGLATFDRGGGLW